MYRYSDPGLSGTCGHVTGTKRSGTRPREMPTSPSRKLIFSGVPPSYRPGRAAENVCKPLAANRPELICFGSFPPFSNVALGMPQPFRASGSNSILQLSNRHRAGTVIIPTEEKQTTFVPFSGRNSMHNVMIPVCQTGIT